MECPSLDCDGRVEETKNKDYFIKIPILVKDKETGEEQTEEILIPTRNFFCPTCYKQYVWLKNLSLTYGNGPELGLIEFIPPSMLESDPNQTPVQYKQPK
jgi:hypothetical protein